MITTVPTFFPGDKVYYVGNKFKDRLHGKPGWIHWQVIGDPNRFVVEFPDTRNNKDQNDTDDYVMSVDVLARQRPAGVVDKKEEKKQEGPEVQPRRRRKTAEEE